MSGRGPACEARTHTGRSAGKQKKGERAQIQSRPSGGSGACGVRASRWLTLSSHSSGKCSRISRGSASAAITMSSAMPRFSVLVAAGATREAGSRLHPARSGGGAGASTFVRALLQLLVVGSLLCDIKDGHRQLSVGQGEGLRVGRLALRTGRGRPVRDAARRGGRRDEAPLTIAGPSDDEDGGPGVLGIRW